jgi:addiction module RelB/DinJ family antitoxin
MLNVLHCIYKIGGNKMTTLNIRIDENLKNDVEKVLCQLGLTTSDAVRIFFSQIRNTQSIPFELKLYDEPTKMAIQAIEESEDDVKNGRVSKPYTDSSQLMADLLKA